MTYELRRDAYHTHIRECKVCVSSYSGTRYFVDERGKYPERYATVSWLCDEARRLLEELI